MIVVDVETTGLEPQRHSIVSIGAVDFSEPDNLLYLECRVWDGAEITAEALGINGFSEEEVKSAGRKSLEEVVREFLEWTEGVRDRTLAGENPSFDRDFLKSSAQRYGIEWTLGHRAVDMHSVCYARYIKRGVNPPMKDGRTDLNSDRIFNYAGLPNEPKPHNALTGAKTEAEALSRLIYGRQLLEEFKQHPVPFYLL